MLQGPDAIDSFQGPPACPCRPRYRFHSMRPSMRLWSVEVLHCASSSETAFAGEAQMRRAPELVHDSLAPLYAIHWVVDKRQRDWHCCSSSSTAGPPAMPSLYSRHKSVTACSFISIQAGGSTGGRVFECWRVAAGVKRSNCRDK